MESVLLLSIAIVLIDSIFLSARMISSLLMRVCVSIFGRYVGVELISSPLLTISKWDECLCLGEGVYSMWQCTMEALFIDESCQFHIISCSSHYAGDILNQNSLQSLSLSFLFSTRTMNWKTPISSLQFSGGEHNSFASCLIALGWMRT